MTAGAVCAATLAVFAASDRIDIFDSKGNFVSVLVSDIEEIKVGKDAGADGYSTVEIITAAGTKSRAISTIGDMLYTPVDYAKAHEIQMAHAPNAKVVLYDWRNNTDYFGEAQIDPTKPADWRGCFPDGNPHFIIDTDKGYASEFAVTGLYTGKVYTDNPTFIFWSLAETNLLGLDSYSFDMPFEPIVISATSVELETYKGAPFLGTYSGFLLDPGQERIVHKMPSTLTAEFRANGTYVMKSTDEYEFDFLDCYDYDEEKNSFAYVPYSGRPVNPVDLEVKTGVEGRFLEGDVMFANFHDLLNDKPDNCVRYFVAKGNYEYSIASANESNNHMLMQAKPVGGGAARYFYITNYGSMRTEVTMDFSYGNNIGASCSGYAVADGERIFRYDYNGPGNDPEFTFRSSEYGTYTGESGDLMLDGFGKSTFNGASGTYTVNGGIATVTTGSDVRLFVVDLATQTYVEMTADKWTGKSQYIKEEAVGAYGGEDECAEGTMRIDFDKNFAGADDPGTACVRFSVRRHDGMSGGVSELVASSGRYIYNAATKTIVITNVYAGTSATTSGRRNIVLKVSDDLSSMWIDNSAEDRIYGTGRNGSYLLTGEINTLSAPVSGKVELAPKYYGEPNMEAYGNKRATETTLTFDAANETAHLKVKGMGTPIFDCDIAYTVDGNTVTLVGVPAYPDGNPYADPVPTDLVMTIGDDGSLISDQKLTGAALGLIFDVDFSSAPLFPAE